MNLLAQLIALLGLQATATEAEALSAITALKTTAAKPAVPAALSTALGLAAGADEAAALAAVTTLKGGDQTTLAAMTALQGQVAALTAQLNGNQVEALVAQAMQAGKLLPAMKQWALDLGKGNLAQLQAYIAAAPVVQLGTQTDGKDPGAGGAAALDAAGKQVLAQMGVKPEDWEKQYGQKAA